MKMLQVKSNEYLIAVQRELEASVKSKDEGHSSGLGGDEV